MANARAVKPVLSRRAFLRLEWALATVLVLVALGWAWLRGVPLLGYSPTSLRAVAAGALAGAGLWLCIPLLLARPEMRRLWDTVLAPFSRAFGTADIALIAVLSGVSEELFFRGVLLPELGLVTSSALFGLMHALNPAYALWAALTGAGFGLLAIATGTLLAPIVAHATYNFGALLLLRQMPAGAPAPQHEAPQ